MDSLLWLNYHSSLFLSFNSDDDTSCVEEIEAEIIIREYDETRELFEEKEEKVGYFQLHYYNVALAINNRMNIYDAFDRSMNTIEIGETIIDPDTGELKDEIIEQIGEPFEPNILVIHDFGIFPQFRNRGLGKKVIKGLIEHYRGKCGLIVLKSFPKQFEGSNVLGKNHELEKKMELHSLEPQRKKAQQKLNTFYRKCGLAELQGSPDFFIKNMDMR